MADDNVVTEELQVGGATVGDLGDFGVGLGDIPVGEPVVDTSPDDLLAAPGGVLVAQMTAEEESPVELKVSSPGSVKAKLPVLSSVPSPVSGVPTLDDLKKVEIAVKNAGACQSVDDVVAQTGLSKQYVLLCLEYLSSLGILPKDTAGRYCGLATITRLQEQLVLCKKCNTG